MPTTAEPSNRVAGAPVPLVFCITDLDPGGAERALVQLATGLDRNCWQPSVICLSGPGALVEPLKQAGIPVDCLGACCAQDVRVLFRLVGRLRRLRPALLQTSLYHANLLGRVVGRLVGVPIIVSGIRVAERGSRFRLWVDRVTERLVDAHVCVSRDVAEFSVHRGGLSAEKVTVIPNGVDWETYAHASAADLSEFGIPPGCRTVLFVGRLDQQKDPFNLLTAAESLFEKHSQLHVLLVGKGRLRQAIETWVREHGVQSRVHVAGWRADVPALLRAAGCLVLSSRWEGLPNVVLEAMAAGVPVVATQVEGTTALVRPGQTGLLVPPESPEELASAISQILTDSARALSMAREAQEFVKKELTWKEAVSQHEHLYRRLLGR